MSKENIKGSRVCSQGQRSGAGGGENHGEGLAGYCREGRRENGALKGRAEDTDLAQQNGGEVPELLGHPFSPTLVPPHLPKLIN